jgi:hypothetical protein
LNPFFDKNRKIKFFSAQKKRTRAIAKFIAICFESCGSQKYGFFGFLRISLKRENPGKFFSAQKKRLDKSNPTVQNSLPYVA